MRSQRGFTTPEWLLGIALIIFPVIVIVGSIAPWYQRANMASLIAQEAARTLVLAEDWAGGEADARQLAADIASNHGFGAVEWCGAPGAGCLFIDFDGPGIIQRGTEVTVSVEVPIPGVVVPGVGSVSEFQWTQTHTERVDDYRSIVVEGG